MKYVCPVCGYVYDDEKEKIPFSELDEKWVCPWCGAIKAVFTPMSETNTSSDVTHPIHFDSDLKKIPSGVLSVIFSNLARGCEKQYKTEEMALFTEIAEYFAKATPNEKKADISTLSELVNSDLTNEHKHLRSAAEQEKDRGTLRICTWGEKVTNIVHSIITRYKNEGSAFLANTEIWVCSVCGFIYIGDSAPSLCPVCKVPDWKFDKIEGRKTV